MKYEVISININQVQVNGRHRKDLGDIDSLANSIEEIGLLQPIIVKQENHLLIGGERRLEAFKTLRDRHGGTRYSYIPAVIAENLDDAYLMLLAERDENTCRKDFAPSEAVAIGKMLEEIERPAAKERQGARTDLQHSGNFPECSSGQTRDKVGASIGMSGKTYEKAKEVIEKAESEPELFGALVEEMDQTGKVDGAHKKMKNIEAHILFTEQTNQEVKDNEPTIELDDAYNWLTNKPPCDLLLTDPPYSTDVEDIDSFALWMVHGLNKVRDTGRAYIFIGAYPKELKAYLSINIPEHIRLEQVLIWEYKNTLGKAPKMKYKQNYQACLYFVGVNAPPLNCPLTEEQWAVQEINAPDGRQGDRYHKWQKPLEIAERFVRHGTKPGDVVYDPFACTGTFLLAAAKLGRIGMGCEIDKDALTIAIERGCKNGA